MSSSSSHPVEFPVAGYAPKEGATPLPCYILMSADILILPVQARPRPPTEITDFRHTTSLKLKRMSEKDADERQTRQAHSGLRELLYEMVREEEGYNNCALRVFGRLCTADQFRGRAQWIILVASSAAERTQWLMTLYSLLGPWSVLKRTMQDQLTALSVSATQRSFSSTSSVPTNAMSSLTITSSQSTNKNEENNLLAAVSSGAERLVEFASQGNKVWSWTATTATNMAGIVRTAQALQEIADPLRAVSLVGPAFLCFAVLARTVASLASEKVNEKKLPAVHAYLRALILDIAEVLIAIVKSEFRDSGLFSRVFEIFEACWEVGAQLERHLLANYPTRLFCQKKALAIVTQVDALRDKMLGVGILRHVISNASIIEELQSELVSLKARIGELEEKEAKDEFKGSFATIPGLPLHVVEDAMPQISDLRAIIEGTLNAPEDSRAGLLVSIRGESGVGKTTACILIGTGDAIRDKYPDGIYFISLGSSFGDQKAIASIAEIVEISGGKKRAAQISRAQLQFAINLARDWFEGRRALLILDNVFPRASSEPDSHNEWVPILSSAFNGSEAGCIFSTRMPHLAEFAIHKLFFQRIDMESDTGRDAAIAIFESYADIETHRGNGDSRFGNRNSSYRKSRDFILSVCSGLPLAIVMAAIHAKRRKYNWDSIARGLRSRVLGSAGSIGVRGGLKAIMEESLAFVDQLSQTAPTDELFDDLDVAMMSCRFGANWFTVKYASLAVFDSSLEVLIPVLAIHLGIDEEQADAFARLCNAMEVGKYALEHRRRQEDATVMCLSLHDLQHAVAEGICEARSGLASIRYHHRSLLFACAERLGGLRRESAVNWSRLFAMDSEALVWPVYFATNLARHLVASVKALPPNMTVIDEQLEGPATDVYWIDGFQAFFTDYRWIRDCSQVLGRMATVILMESAIKQHDKSESYLFGRGLMEGIAVICDVLKSIRSEDFRRRDACLLHGVVDSGLAGQLYGRIEVLQFRSLDREERENALNVVNSLQKSIVRYAQRPWLRPITACYRSAEEKDPKCCQERMAGDGVIYSVVPFKFRGKPFAASACRDGTVSLHDIDDTRAGPLAFRGHTSVVNGLACASNGFQGDLVIASSSLDGTILLWRLREMSRSQSTTITNKDVSLLGSLRGRRNEEFNSVAITPDCRRIVAGSILKIPGDIHPVRFPVYVFTMRSEIDGDQVQFEAEVPWEHTDLVKGVKISNDGETVVSVTKDGALHVWSPECETNPLLTWTALVTQSQGEEICCLDLTPDGRYLCCGTSNNLHLWDLATRRCVRSFLHPLEAQWTPPVVSLSIAHDPSDNALINYRIFTGHVEGSIMERTFFGNSSGHTITHKKSRGFGYVYCLSAEPVERGIGREVGGNREQVSTAMWRILSGHGDGRVRVWAHEKIVEDAMSRVDAENQIRAVSSDGTATSVPQGLAKSVAWTRNGKTLAYGFSLGGFRTWNAELGILSSVTAMENRVAIPLCIDFSGDTHYLVAGSGDGDVSLWQGNGGAILRTLKGHSGEVTVVIFSWFDKHVISGDSVGECRVWDIETSQCVHIKSGIDNSPVISLSVGRANAHADVGSSNAYSEIVCSWYESGLVTLWKLLSGDVLHNINLDLTATLARPSVRHILLKGNPPASVQNAKWRERRSVNRNYGEAVRYELDELRGTGSNISIRKNKIFPSMLDVLFVDLMGKPLCECAASIQFDCQPQMSGTFAFNQEHAGGMRTIVGCSLAYSDVTAFMELMRKN